MIMFLDDGDSAHRRSCHPMMQSLGKISVTARTQFAGFAVDFQFQSALDHKNKTLRWSAAKLPPNFELIRVLRELRAERRTDVQNCGARLHSRQSRAHK